VGIIEQSTSNLETFKKRINQYIKDKKVIEIQYVEDRSHYKLLAFIHYEDDPAETKYQKDLKEWAQKRMMDIVENGLEKHRSHENFDPNCPHCNWEKNSEEQSLANATEAIKPYQERKRREESE
jgi:cytolysin (calcineurin-like family phosphatase)